MKKGLLTFLILFISLVSANAVKTKSGATIVKQSDGTQLTVFGYGDEDLHWYMTKDSVLLYHEGFNYYIAKINDNGELECSSQIAHEPALRDAVEAAMIAAQDKSLFFSSLTTNASRKAIMKEPINPESSTPHYFSHTDSPKVLVVLADFSDSTFWYNDEATIDIFNEYLNAEGRPSSEYEDTEYYRDPSRKNILPYGDLSTNYGSVKKYFTDMSHGKFTPQFDIKALVHLDHPLKYYGQDSGSSTDPNIYKLVTDVCTAIDDSINFADYDNDGDGYVDLLYIIYAGYSESMSSNSTECIWPKCGTISYIAHDGVKICRYGVNNELNFNPTFTTENGLCMNGIGLFCHEFSHALGLPDLYCSAAQQNNQAMEDWDLMDGGEYVNGGYCPTAYTAWEREAMGWMDITDLTKKGTYKLTTLTLEASSEDYTPGNAYRIKNETDTNEYYILENIQKIGWNKYLGIKDHRPHGLMITHVDYNESKFKLGNQPNSTKNHPRMTVLPANGELISSYIDSDNYADNMEANLFPGTTNTTTFNYVIKDYPISIVYYGKVKDMQQKSLFNITETDNIIKFDFMEESPSAISEITIDTKDDAPIYTIDGRLVATSRNALPHGIFIQNGHKFIK